MRWLGFPPFMLVACSPAAAPPAVVEAPVAASAMVEEFNPEQIIKLVAPMDYTPMRRVAESPQANASVDFTGPGGETWRAEARHCVSHRQGAKCEGITLTSRFTTPRATAEGMLDYANRFNTDQATVFMFQEGKDLVVSDDIVLDGGISEVNLEAQLAAFSTVLRQNREFLLRAAGVIE